VARNTAKHSSPFMYRYLKPLLDALCHQIMSMSVSVKQRQSLPELQVKIKSQVGRIEENRLLLVDFSDMSTLFVELDPSNARLQQLGYKEEAVSWMHMLASFLYQWFKGPAAFSGDNK